MDNPAIEFQSIIPANKVLTIAKGVASFFALVLEEGGELWLTKYTRDRSVIWHRMLGSFERNVPLGTYSIMEDEQAFIHIVIPYNQVFLPHFNDLADNIETNDNTIIATLFSNGKVKRINKYPNLSAYKLVKIINDVWLVADDISKCSVTIQIRNLTQNAFISNIFANRFIQLANVYWRNDELFIVGLTNGPLTCRGRTISIPNLSAFLLVIDTIDWEIKTWFRADVTKKSIEECDPATQNCDLFVLFSSILVTEDYFMSVYTSAKGINIYHERDLIKSIELEKDNTLLFVKISVENNSIAHVSVPTGSIQIRNYSTQFFHMVKDNHIVFATLENNFVLADFLGVKRELYSSSHYIFLRFTQDLEFRGYHVIGSGTAVPMIARGPCVCSQSDCTKTTGKILCSRIPCRVMRLFPPGYTTVQDGCPNYTGKSCTKDYKGTVPGANFLCDAGTNPVTPCGAPNFYTCFNNNQHCLAIPDGDQPGDLYNTKYQGINLVQPQSIATVGNTSSPTQLGSNFIVNTEDNILLSGQFIDTLISNGEAKAELYRQRLFGYVVNLNYN